MRLFFSSVCVEEETAEAEKGRTSKQQQAHDDERAQHQQQPRQKGLVRLLRGQG